jgi:hypothetical protein
MARTVEFYSERAIVAFNKGFNTMADKKRCLEDVSRAYDVARHLISDGLLNLRSTGAMTDEDMQPLYWAVPFQLNHYRPKHSDMFRGFFPEAVETIEYLVQLREQVKAQPIVKVAPKVSVEQAIKVEYIEKTLAQIFAYNMAQYERGLKINEVFGGLHVSVTPHWVFRDGGKFIRYFYFMEGKMTALNTILAVMQTIADEKEKVKK